MLKRIKARINKFVDARIRAKALAKYGCDLVCPQCKAWMHCHDNTSSVPVPNNPAVYNYTCGNCGKMSAWDFGLAPIPIMIDGTELDIGEVIKNPGSVEDDAGHPQYTRKNIGTVYSFHNFFEDVAKDLVNKSMVYAVHSAWNFVASIWYEENQYHSYVMQYRHYIATYSDPDLRALINKVNSVYGTD
jgi:hypothetical protein